MKNVCFLIGNLNDSGGTERVTSLIANKLCEDNRYNIFILSLWEGQKPFFSLNANIKTYSLYNIKPSFKKQLFPTIKKIRKFVKDNKIDILIDVDSILCVFTVPALMSLNINHICWEHFNFNANLGVKLRDIGRKLAARYCDYVVTLTKKDKELWEQHLSTINAKIVPIPNPSPYENIINAPSLDFKIVLAVGRLTSQKGFDLLIEAWSLVCQNRQDWILRIVGDGEDEAMLKNLAQELGVANFIEFLPSTRDIEQYYRSASLYCMSSRYEGLPMVLIEAQMYGLPIVSFDCDTGPSDVIENKKNGFLVKPESIEELAEKISMLINIDNDVYKEISNACKLRSEDFLIVKIINKWIDIL